MRRRHGFFLVLFVLGAALLSPQAADAAGPLKYVTRTKIVAAAKRASLMAPCPRGTSVTGGGVSVDGDDVNDAVATSAPYDNGDAGRAPNNGWKGTVNNAPAIAHQMTVFAICAKRIGGIAYGHAGVNLAASSPPSNLAAGCPGASQSAAGGGVSLTPGSMSANVRESRPAVTHTAWRGVVENGSLKVQHFDVYVACTKLVTPSYVEIPFTIAPGPPAQSFGADCPPGMQVIGGGGTTDDPNVTPLHSTEPADDGVDGVPDNGWRVRFANGSLTGVNGTVFAICMSPV